jgi:hypothetical protein
MTFLFHRGDQVIDKLTQFSGVIVERSDSLTGCNRYCVQPPVDKEGKWREGYWIDEHCLELDTSKKRVALERHVDQPPG